MISTLSASRFYATYHVMVYGAATVSGSPHDAASICLVVFESQLKQVFQRWGKPVTTKKNNC